MYTQISFTQKIKFSCSIIHDELDDNDDDDDNDNNNNNHSEVADSIPGTSTNFKCGLGLKRGPPSLARTIR